MITLTQKLNVVSIGVPPIIHLSQYDSDFSLVFELYASTGNFTLPSGTTAEIRGTKADGNGYDADATVSGTTITVTGDEQMTAAAGCNVFEIALYKSGKRLNTINFILQVEHAALDADTITSESVLKELNAIIEGAATATQAAQDADAAADRAEAAANDLSGTVQQVATNTQDIANLKDDLTELDAKVDAIVPGLSDEAKEALLACFDHVAWIDEHGQDYYDALYDALYEEEPPTPSFEYGVYEPESIINGKYIDNTGTVIDGQTNKSFYIEDYIPVVKGSYWIGFQPPTMRTDNYHYWSESNWRVSEYDNNKQFIKQTQYAGSQSVGAKSATIVSFEQNTKYIRLGFYDYYNPSSSPNHVFDIEDPATITELPMEAGDINASTGQNASEPRRIRTTGYIPITGSTVTVTGCPFYTSWMDFNPNSIYAVRCYDSNKTYLGNVVCNEAKVMENVNVPSGTAYARMIMQGGGENFDDHVNLSAYLFTVNGVKYFVT